MKLALDTGPKKRRRKNGTTMANFQCTKRMLELIRKEAENRGQTMSAYMRDVVSDNLADSGTTITAGVNA